MKPVFIIVFFRPIAPSMMAANATLTGWSRCRRSEGSRRLRTRDRAGSVPLLPPFLVHVLPVPKQVDDRLVVHNAGEPAPHGTDRGVVSHGVVGGVDITTKDHVIVKEVAGTRRRFAAEVRQCPADEDGLDVLVTEDVVKVGSRERVVCVLYSDHSLPRLRIDLVVDIRAFGSLLDRAASDQIPILIEVGATVRRNVVG